MTKPRGSATARLALATIAALIAGATPVAATTMLPASLPEAVREAGTIVHGTVQAVRSGRDERGLPATWVTLQVVTMVKGQAADTVEFKQFGDADGGPADSAGNPSFAVGQEVVVLLRRPSSWGFTSPVDALHGVRVVAAGPAAVTAAVAPAELRIYLEQLRALVAAER